MRWFPWTAGHALSFLKLTVKLISTMPQVHPRLNENIQVLSLKLQAVSSSSDVTCWAEQARCCHEWQMRRLTNSVMLGIFVMLGSKLLTALLQANNNIQLVDATAGQDQKEPYRARGLHDPSDKKDYQHRDAPPSRAEARCEHIPHKLPSSIALSRCNRVYEVDGILHKHTAKREL